MSGRDEVRLAQRPAETGNPVVLKVRDLPFGNHGSEVSFDIRAGEILGLYGLVGAGRSSLMKIVWGATSHDKGGIFLNGKTLRPGRIGDRIVSGGAYVPEDRRHEGLITSRTIAENLAIANLAAVRLAASLPWTSVSALKRRAEEVRKALSVKMGSPLTGR
nr:ATP-binding cassette domain-containing protein [Marinicella sp. W31]MDC2880261.1 ATP-binding cassette domain-containing protein [Marinicella sp. W31]